MSMRDVGEENDGRSKTWHSIRNFLAEILAENTRKDGNKNVADEILDRSAHSLEFAIEYYKATRPGIDQLGDGRRVLRKPSITRANLQKIGTHLEKLIAGIDELDGDGRVLLTNAMSRPAGWYRRTLCELQMAVESASKLADKLPNKETNHERVSLAADVAIVLRGLDLNISSYTTAHSEACDPLYEKTLRFCLKLVGECNGDWKKLTADGMAAADDLNMIRASSVK